MFQRFSIDSLCGECHRNKDIVLILRELSIHTDTNNIAVLSELPFQICNVLFVGTGAVPAGHLHAVVGLGIHGVRIVKCAGVLRWVSAHQQAVVIAGKRTLYSLHDGVSNAGCLVHHEKHIVFVEALHILRLGGCAGYGKPAFLMPFHVNAGLCPNKHSLQDRAAFLPLGNLGPEDIVQLLAGRCRAHHAGIREARKKPKDQVRFKGGFANALPRANRHLMMLRNGRSSFFLPRIRRKASHLRKEFAGIFAVQGHPPGKDFTLLHRHRLRPPIPHPRLQRPQPNRLPTRSCRCCSFCAGRQAVVSPWTSGAVHRSIAALSVPR